MTVLFTLLLASLLGVIAAFSLPGWSNLIVLAGPMALGSFLLLLRAVLRRPKGAAPAQGR
jgi:hypothetical protein